MERRPRLCFLSTGGPNPNPGFGFHLRGERTRGGQWIRRVEPGSCAELSGLRAGDRVVEVNGENVERETHHQVVDRIQAGVHRTRLLVIDRETDEYLRSLNLPCTEDLAVEMGTFSPRPSPSTSPLRTGPASPRELLKHWAKPPGGRGAPSASPPPPLQRPRLPLRPPSVHWPRLPLRPPSVHWPRLPLRPPSVHWPRLPRRPPSVHWPRLPLRPPSVHWPRLPRRPPSVHWPRLPLRPPSVHWPRLPLRPPPLHCPASPTSSPWTDAERPTEASPPPARGEEEAELVPRLCHLTKQGEEPGYGFNLHSDKMRRGQFVGSVDPGSPAQRADVREGDRLLQVNGASVAGLRHAEVVALIQKGGRETRLLLVDLDTDELFLNLGVEPSSQHLQEVSVDGPVRRSPSRAPSPAAALPRAEPPIINITVTDSPIKSSSPKSTTNGSWASQSSRSSTTQSELSSSDMSIQVPDEDEGGAPDPFLELGLRLSPTAAEAKEKALAQRSKKRAPPMDWGRKYQIFSNF
ncbi:LOW QUALITY PROTEIN: Na(+)/H(+) exchange regulatory cofactor NHE-RF2 [Gadus morhua]|uniref:LOW QUALITY PROTEIN: Na(+)/H(+) exchange regulatory cofactor NHE-RF2 n=1 Tax=Gadus morhua TaxID=8049 RepID=UPI0011B7AB52|nr:LOW QUALITY PROTEIN: Na(+)/H(+) exchange regulatory cofactor NHE-RF2-like [Gadus morhua]